MRPAAALALAFSVPSAAADPPHAAGIEAAIDRAARGYMADACHVGLSIVARYDGRSHFYDYGSTRRDRVTRPTPDSVYEPASVTKTFTGALAARAPIDGWATLDGDFRAYLQEPYPNLERGGRPITLRLLATHTSGLQRDLPDSDALMAHPDYDHIGAQLAALDAGYDGPRTLAAMHDIRLRSAPGKTFAYSNLGIRLIGYGLEHFEGAPFAALPRRAILAPLGMRDTAFTPSATMRARLVVPYSRYRDRPPYHDDLAGAAYGRYATPRAMARYFVWQLDERDPVVAFAHRPIRGTADDGEGLIWNIGRNDGEKMLWRGGGSLGMTSQMGLFPAAGQGFVLLANDACAGGESALKSIAITIRAALR